MVYLFDAGRYTEIRGRSAYIMDIAFEIRFFREKLCLFHNGFMTPGLDDPSLMKGQCTEAAASETAPVADQREFDLWK